MFLLDRVVGTITWLKLLLYFCLLRSTVGEIGVNTILTFKESFFSLVKELIRLDGVKSFYSELFLSLKYLSICSTICLPLPLLASYLLSSLQSSCNEGIRREDDGICRDALSFYYSAFTATVAIGSGSFLSVMVR